MHISSRSKRDRQLIGNKRQIRTRVVSDRELCQLSDIKSTKIEHGSSFHGDGRRLLHTLGRIRHGPQRQSQSAIRNVWESGVDWKCSGGHFLPLPRRLEKHNFSEAPLRSFSSLEAARFRERNTDATPMLHADGGSISEQRRPVARPRGIAGGWACKVNVGCSPAR
jgi:hypothetical protein